MIKLYLHVFKMILITNLPFDDSRLKQYNVKHDFQDNKTSGLRQYTATFVTKIIKQIWQLEINVLEVLILINQLKISQTTIAHMCCISWPTTGCNYSYIHVFHNRFLFKLMNFNLI